MRIKYVKPDSTVDEEKEDARRIRFLFMRKYGRI